RETSNENDVVLNLMNEFSIDSEQAEYVSEIKLRNINIQYISRRIREVESLKKDIAEMEEILKDKNKIRNIIIKELKNVIKNYAQPRKSLISEYTEQDTEITDDIPDYPVNIFVSASGYFKKITPQSLRMSSEHKLKDGDYIIRNFEATNKTELIFFTDKQQAYKSKASSFDDTKASLIGDYIPAKLSFSEDETLRTLIPTTDYSGYMMFFFENGKGAKIPLSAYETKTNRKKLTKAYSDKSLLVEAIFIQEDCDILVRSSSGHTILFNTSEIQPKTTRDSQGVQLMNLKKNSVLASAEKVTGDGLEKYRVKSIPSSGKQAKELGDVNQLELI
ncbi:MAG: topoisomerase IV, partial [Ruminococcus sp.]|nr:topoisomerase IV [Ruminococcus sp.]